MDYLISHPYLQAVLSHMLTVAGFILAVFLIARLMSEKRQPGNTFAWLLGIVLIPYLGVPLYLLFGGRKLRRLMNRKSRLTPTVPDDKVEAGSCAERHVARAVRNAGGSLPLGRNEMTLLTNGEDAYRALAQGIEEAKECIHITTFILGREDTGKRIVQLLAKRAREGIRVRLLLDSVGSMFIRSGFVAPIIEAGGEVQWFMRVLPLASRGSANLRSHRKIAVFDHRTAIVGGHNIAREYMGAKPWAKRWTDFGAVIQGPAAAMLNDVFIADWCFASGQPIENVRAEVPATAFAGSGGTAELQVIVSGPDVNGDPLYEGLVAMIQSAARRIVIITPYFIPDEVLQRSLIVKARSGIDITLLVPARSNHPVTDFARKHYLRELREAGVIIKLHGPGMMHSKATIIDDTIALFGSANFDLRSLFVNFEIGVLVHSRKEVAAMSDWAQSLLNRAKDAKPAKRGRFHFAHSLVEDLSRLLAPLL